MGISKSPVICQGPVSWAALSASMILTFDPVLIRNNESSFFPF